ncbi:hypothetical protein Tco_0843809, partial [Tanacetum coccineum]
VASDDLRDALSAIFGLSELKEIIVMSADSAVTYTSVHSEARSWSIPSEDPYEEAARQLLEQAPRSPEYLHDSMELEDHVPMLSEPRLLLTTPRPSCEVGESSAAAARQPGPTMAHRVDCSSIDTMKTRIRDTERRMSYDLEMVKHGRVKFTGRCSQLREFGVLLTSSRCQKESLQLLKLYRALEARVTVLETVVRRHEWQRHAVNDLAVQHIMRTQALEAGAPVDTLEDTGSSS